jgi:hypothetical protein
VYLVERLALSVVNLKTGGKILPSHLQQRIRQKDSIEALNLGCYAESFCLVTSCGILNGNFQPINR